MKILLIMLMIFLVQVPSVIGTSLFTGVNPITDSIFTDRRARAVGDIITIVLNESANTAHSGSTTLKKKSSLVAKITSLLFPVASATSSATDAAFSHLPFTGSRTGLHNGTLPNSEMDSQSDFDGEGELSSTDSIQGKITAMIVDVYPNGNFLIEGTRKLWVDGQERTMKVSGLVRPEDIGADNTVMSEFVAEAEIHLSGRGPVTNQRKQGILLRILDAIGLY